MPASSENPSPVGARLDPLPLVGRGQGWGESVVETTEPPLPASPTRGEEKCAPPAPDCTSPSYRRRPRRVACAAHRAGARRPCGARVTVSSLPHCAFDTALPIRHRHSGLRRPTARWPVRALDLRRNAGTDHVPLGATPCAARKWRSGLERRARHRALRRQIANDISVAQGRHSRRRARASAKRKPTHANTRRNCDRPLVMKPLFGSQGKGIGRSHRKPNFPRARPSITSITCRTTCRRATTCSRIGACSQPGIASSPP